MRRVFYALIVMTVMASCQTENKNVAYLSGKVLSGGFKQVKLEWMNEKALDYKGDSYAANVAEDGSFSFEIPVSEIVNGRMVTDNFFHTISLMPGDDIYVTIDTDTVNYSGTGASKNNFHYSNESSDVWQFRDKLYQQRPSAAKFIEGVQKFKLKRDSLIVNSDLKTEMEQTFIDYYQMDIELECVSGILGYSTMMAYMQQVPIDSLQLPNSYYQVASLSKVVADERLLSLQYLHVISTVMHIQAEKMIKTDTSLSEEQVKIQIFKDSLNGLTKEYALAQYIYSKLSRDEYNTAAIDYFNSLNTNKKTTVFVKDAIEKYELKQQLVEQPLHADMLATILEDTAGNALTFGDVMQQLKGKVIYLDMWSLGCGPCRMAMPYSKTMKQKLNDYPVEIVYLTSDRASENLWHEVFDVSQTTHNHYRLVNGFDSKINQLFEIFWVPNYMIIDKEGKLVDYKADRPTAEVEHDESDLLKQLKVLAQK